MNGAEIAVERIETQAVGTAYKVRVNGKLVGAAWKQGATPLDDCPWVSVDCRRQDPDIEYHRTKREAVAALSHREALILACSRAKRRPGEGIWVADGKAPAVWVYDGPWWRILRRYNPHVAVLALSGKFGLVPACDLISYYDLEMGDAPDATWLDDVLLPKAGLLDGFDAVWICVPQTGGYAKAVEALEVQQGASFRDVAEVLKSPADEALLARNPYFARTRALTVFCRQRGFRLDGAPMPMGESLSDWQRLVGSGAILGR